MRKINVVLEKYFSFRSSRSQIFYKIGVLQTFKNLHETLRAHLLQNTSKWLLLQFETWSSVPLYLAMQCTIHKYYFLTISIRYHSLAPMYYRGSQAAIVVYDIQNPVRMFSVLSNYLQSTTGKSKNNSLTN